MCVNKVVDLASKYRVLEKSRTRGDIDMEDQEKEILMKDNNLQLHLPADYEYNALMSLLRVSVSKHLLDDHFTVIWANDFYYELIGWSKDEYEETFHNQCDLYYKEHDQAEWERIGATVIGAIENNRNGYNIVTSMRRKNGDYVWVRLTAAFSDEYIDGKQVSYTVMTDISDLVQMQKEQSVTYKSLPGFVAKYRIEEDARMTLLDANERFMQYFCEDDEDGSGSALYHKNMQENIEVIKEKWEEIRAGKPIQFVMHVRDRLNRELWLQVNATCVDWQRGQPVYLVIFIDITDVTELREMQKQLTEQKMELEEALTAAERANQAKSEFLSRMSHDIRTPMNAVMWMTRIAKSHKNDPNRVEDCLEKIDTSSKLLMSLINEVLDMSKIESGRMMLSEEEINLADLVQGVVTMVQPQIRDKKLKFSAHINDTFNEIVISDMQRLQQLLLNLLSNAVKYTPDEGAVLFEINQRPSENADIAYYKFVVADTGIGMKPDFLERIFEPFERANDEKIQMIQGTGLGLSICKKITELMGGTIRVESEYGKGSRFTAEVMLRLQEETIDEHALNGLPILVVDDDETICLNTCERLENFGMNAEWTLDGKSALEKVLQAHKTGKDYFAVIIDMQMPEMDGMETTRRIRESVGADLPVIMISAYDLSEQMDAATLAGANGFITKPLFRSRLVYKLRQFLEGNVTETPLPLQEEEHTYAGKRVLLAEDNELNREIAEELLSRFGVSTEAVVNGKEALNKVAASPEGYYDLVFMDMQMPIMDGCAASAAIRALPRGDAETIPIVAMTANAFEDDRQKTHDAGMNGHLAKPVDMEQMRQIMQRWLDK